MKKVMYICPNCFKIHDTVRLWWNSYGYDIYRNGKLIKSTSEETEPLRIDFPCQHQTEAYSIDDVEVIINSKTKTITISSEFSEFEDEIKKVNPEFSGYKFTFE